MAVLHYTIDGEGEQPPCCKSYSYALRAIMYQSIPSVAGNPRAFDQNFCSGGQGFD